MENEKNEDYENIISVGMYIIISKNKYSKLHLLTKKSNVQLGKDKIDLQAIIGHPFWSTYKMLQKKRNEFTLLPCSTDDILESSKLVKNNIKSGPDNRNICDTSTSQMLSTEDIVELRTSGLSSHAIVGQLIENSKTFQNKTEYSQEKYLKKKGIKYFEYITIKKPTVRLYSEMFYAKDPARILGLRTDSLSQIATAVNLQPDGTYLLFESGSQGLVAASILNLLVEPGKLINITPTKFPQQHAVLSMNFNKTKLGLLKYISIFKMAEQIFNSKISKTSQSDIVAINNTEDNVINNGTNITGNNENTGICVEEISDVGSKETNKRKACVLDEDSNGNETKKPKWEIEAEETMNLFKPNFCDGLIIVCKEYSNDLLMRLLTYLKYSRNFVVFNLCREPLSQLYVELKSRHDVINLKLTETWLRSYQVMSDRTHPDVLMSGNSGYLLTGTLINYNL